MLDYHDGHGTVVSAFVRSSGEIVVVGWNIGRLISTAKVSNGIRRESHEWRHHSEIELSIWVYEARRLLSEFNFTQIDANELAREVGL